MIFGETGRGVGGGVVIGGGRGGGGGGASMGFLHSYEVM
jgi:hypothetical protein